MGILSRFTLKDLKLNKKRSIVTIIAITLSTALICAVACMFYSFKQILADEVIDYEGNYHTIFENVNNENEKVIKNNRKIKEIFEYKEVGKVILNETSLLTIYNFDENTFNNFNVKISDGRLPKNSSEIILSNSYNGYYNTKYKINNEITFNVMNENNETSNTYKIVGFFEDISHFSDYDTIISYEKNISGSRYVGVLFNNIKDTYKITNDISKSLDIENSVNTDLMKYNGIARSDETQRTLYIILGIVIGIIVVCSVFVIRNSFAISITEKKKELGMLISIGSTKRQIRNIVIKEGLFLSLIGIPLGILCGILAAVCLVLFTNGYLFDAFGGGIDFKVTIPWAVIAITVVGALVTVLLSCIVSAFKASRISPIDTIRNAQDIKIKSRKVKSNKLIKKIFGIGGDIANKNLKRSKKRYRTTIISLTVSIAVFIALSSFVSYGFDLVNLEFKDIDYNVMATIETESNENSVRQLQKLTTYNGIKEYSINLIKSSDKSNIGEILGITDQDLYYYNGLDVYALDEKSFNEYLKLLNIKDAKNIFVNTYNKNPENIKFNSEKSYDIDYSTDKKPYGYSSYVGDYAFVITCINNENLEEYDTPMFISNVKDADKFVEYINDKNINEISITNLEETALMVNRIYVWMCVFLYGFIIVITLIGVTNVFNTITTNMALRSKEFAVFKSIGMTKKEFNHMVRLESIMYGLKSLFWGIGIGVLLSYILYANASEIEILQMNYKLPILSILICVAFVFIVVSLTMRFSMNKINKQNIIETIRKDNI